MTNKEIEILKQTLGSYIPTKNGTELNFTCPFPGCNKDRKKLSINKNTGKWHCWRCETRGKTLDYLISRFGSFEHKQLWGEITNQVDFSLLEQFLFPKTEQKEETKKIYLPKEFISLVGNHSLSALAARNYLGKRGITEEEICYWKMGFCQSGKYVNRIIFPSFDINGRLNYFVARTYDEAERKYNNPPAKKKDIIFNELLIDLNNPIILVEGVFDSLIAGDNSIPLLGSFLREDYKLLKIIAENNILVYLALDPDAIKKENAIIRMFRKFGIQMKKIDINPFKDVGSMTRKEFQKRKQLAMNIGEDSLLQNLLEGV